ncbi:serine protease [Favolaschia claudopus]|uniref:Serine protease n=1 Tax=Favolaschia claudopus TaxID=2862362 RepID=A0AAV9ZAR5_9AGAR
MPSFWKLLSLLSPSSYLSGGLGLGESIVTQNPLSISNQTFNSNFGARPTIGVEPDNVPWYLQRIGSAAPLDVTVERMSEYTWSWRRKETWGENVFVYVIDTGVRGTHEQFRQPGGVLPGMTLQRAGNDDGRLDQNGHGTMVASVITGRNNGVAQAATIVPIKIFGEGNSAKEFPWTTTDVAEGIDWAIQDFRQKKTDAERNRVARPPMAVINISWIIRRDPEASRAIREAIEEEMHVVIAAGNDNQDQCYVGKEKFPETERVSPEGQITVSVTDPEDEWAYNYGNCVDLVAPGMYFTMASNEGDQDYEGDSGSSMATPLVSGVIAAILSEQGPTTPASMKELLLTEYVTVGAVRNVPPKSPDRLLLAAKLWPKVL